MHDPSGAVPDEERETSYEYTQFSGFTDVTPRYVPIGVKLRVRFGGFASQFGWLFLGFGLIFVWVFGVDGTVVSVIAWRRDTATAPGVVRACESTGVQENNVTVYRFGYTFTPEGDVERAGTCYATGRQLTPGTAVTVEYVKRDPSFSRIKGMRTSLIGPWGLFILIFPLVGLGFVIVSLVRSRKRLRLLRDGITGVGTLVDRKATHTQINNQTVFKYTYEFTSKDGNTYQAVGRSHLPDIFSEEDEPLLYDPLNPNYAVMMDNIPGSPRIDEAGNIHTDKPFLSVLVLVIPLATLIAHTIVIANRYF